MKNDPSYVATAWVLYAYFYTRAPGVGGRPVFVALRPCAFPNCIKQLTLKPTVDRPNNYAFGSVAIKGARG